MFLCEVESQFFAFFSNSKTFIENFMKNVFVKKIEKPMSGVRCLLSWFLTQAQKPETCGFLQKNQKLLRPSLKGSFKRYAAFFIVKKLFFAIFF
jgi:hypothetical protein